MSIAGIILAGGKGTRINANGTNKVALPFLGRPIISYAVELLNDICAPLVVVVGAFPKSVKDALQSHEVIFANQMKRLGTAHATEVGLLTIRNSSTQPALVLVGYGDHMMFYKKATIKKLIELQQKEKAAIGLISTIHENPDRLAWGRIIRSKNGVIIDNIEQKDATPEERKITELNAGFYCFDYDFLKKNIQKVEKSSISGEYYLNSLIEIAVAQKRKVVSLKVPFLEVGIGINNKDELVRSQNLYSEEH